MDIKALLQSDQSFALLEKQGQIDVCVGTMHECACIDDIGRLYDETGKEIVFVLPFHIIRERGFDAVGDEPVLALVVNEKTTLDAAAVRGINSESSYKVAGKITPNLSDKEFEAAVKAVQSEEIEGGNASQVVLSRYFEGSFAHFSPEQLLVLYQELMNTGGQYMTVFVANRASRDKDKHHYLLAATPECHVEMTDEKTVMTPIAGTFRKGDGENFEPRLAQFLKDEKEINELFQVVDEEMKMMGIICPQGGNIHGPYMREIGAVIHTEYKLEGTRSGRALDALKHTLHAPTVIGGPMESAARIVAAREKQSRRYYAGEIGVYKGANDTLDCAIFLRGIDVFENGDFRVQAGAGVVRDSDPISEQEETKAKAASVLAILQGNAKSHARLLTPEIEARLTPIMEERNAHLSHFWFEQQTPIRPPEMLYGLDVTIINNEDDFAHMIAHILRYQGCNVRVEDTHEFDASKNPSKVVVLGPGPGDVNDGKNPRMVALNQHVISLRNQGRLIMGVCLGHQALAKFFGLPVVLQETSTQGVQKQIHVFGRDVRVGFYNSFSPELSDNHKAPATILFDVDNQNRILAMKGDGFVSFQFHPESVLSEKGYELLTESLINLRLQRI